VGSAANKSVQRTWLTILSRQTAFRSPGEGGCGQLQQGRSHATDRRSVFLALATAALLAPGVPCLAGSFGGCGTYSSSKVMNELLVWGPSPAQHSSRLFITLPRSDMLGGLWKEHASPGYEFVAPTPTRFQADLRVCRVGTAHQSWSMFSNQIGGRCPPYGLSKRPAHVFPAGKRFRRAARALMARSTRPTCLALAASRGARRLLYYGTGAARRASGRGYVPGVSR